MDFVKLTIETKRAERGEGAVLSSSADRFLSVMTYNIRHGRGRDGRVDLDRICAVIQEGRPDLIALQEVDRGMTRSGRIDQGARIADRLEMHWAPGHNGTLEGGVFGNVLLSRWPLTPLENIDLTVPGPDSFVESSADLEHWTTFAWLGPRDPDLHVESFAFRIVADRPRAFWRIR